MSDPIDRLLALSRDPKRGVLTRVAAVARLIDITEGLNPGVATQAAYELLEDLQGPAMQHAACKAGGSLGGSRDKTRWGILAVTVSLLRENPDATCRQLWYAFPEPPDDLQISHGGLDYILYRHEGRLVQEINVIESLPNPTASIAYTTFERRYVDEARKKLKKK